ncbi:spore gernimation protein [Clostridium autoethanogenum]|uniref:Predicted spore germination protein n=2 Tax=Clostridium TaxID=1485 RepID=D8GU47_CLOLD|nr:MULTISPECIES: endospore germination permease [Clostridium]ADK14710.1 predicted spore germination protein [Clostridium ljungdahlii DSM 13528]OAA85947.1 Spore germination protein YndE [Clostridium ljungdahlii DSM 13528]RMC99976.1 spore gernimation protein [Clostridium autoethanogenum]
MKIEKGIISNTQLTFLIIGLLQSASITVAFVSGITKSNTWISLLTSFIIISFMMLVYTSLNKRYPDKNLIEINTIVYGRYLGKIISILYIFFFWFLIPSNVRGISDIYSTYLFPQTDLTIFVVVIILTCMYTIKKGIEVIARIGSILTILIIIVTVIITVLILNDMHLSNFLPLFQINFKKFIQGTNIMVSIPFGELITFLMIFPYVNDKGKVKRFSFWGLIIGTIQFLIIILRNTAVLGNIGYIHVLPSYQVARLINIGEVITRMEILFGVMLLFNVFLKICIFYYATVLSIAQFFKLQSYNSLVIPLGIISIIFSITMYSSPAEESNFASTYSIYAIIFVILFPSISLIIAWIRNLST